MNNKAFTLVELIGVIIILGLIAIIAFPPVIKQIQNSKSSIDKATEKMIISNTSNYLEDNKNNYPRINNSIYCITLQELVDKDILSKDLKDANGKKLDFKKMVEVEVINNTYKYNIKDDCSGTSYKDYILKGADPEIGSGMIPVTIESNGTVRKADVSKKWYDYSNKEWANVVTVTEDSRNNYMSSKVGTIINETDILTYLVWIPRYKYKLWNTDNVANTGIDSKQIHSIEIEFENKNTSTANGNTNGAWLTHPAFTFGKKELNGIWVGKFESGYKGATSTSSSQISTADSSKVIIKPNSYSWRGISISNIFTTVKGMGQSNNVYGLSSSNDTHLIKNIEWGAIAYLSHSIYGINKQIRINNNTNRVTGCAATIEDGTGVASCQNLYNSEIGIMGSTTGNITGIYDMAGGSWEYVMGYTTGAATKYGQSGFTDATFPSAQYLDTYTSTVNTNYGNGHLGDATKEMGPFLNTKNSWYDDYANFVFSGNPWFFRGGESGNGSITGVFAYNNGPGYANSGLTFRVVIS